MKLLFKTVPVIGLIAMAGCSNDEALENEGISKTTATIVNEETGCLKSYLIQKGSGYVSKWSENDSYIFSDGTKTVKFSNGTTDLNSFSIEGTDYPSADKGTLYYAYFPASGFNSFAGGVYNVTLPTEQTYTVGTVAKEAYPMMAVAENTTGGNGADLSFYNAASLFVVNVKTKSGSNKVKSITLSSDQLMSGVGTASMVLDGKPTLSVTEGNKYVVLNCGEGVDVDSSGYTSFYIALPYNDYTNFSVGIDYALGGTKNYDKGSVTFRRSYYHDTDVEMSVIAGGGQGTSGDSGD